MTGLAGQLDGCIELVFDPHEKRIPKGAPHGGEWARDVGGGWTRFRTSHRAYRLPDPERLVLAKPTKVQVKRPEDHAFYRENPVNPANIVSTWGEASPEERAQGMRWYPDAHLLADAVASAWLDGDTTKAAIITSAYSPRTRWPLNMFNAARAAKEGRALGPGDGQITAAFQRNAQEGLDGWPIDKALPENKGAKTNSFAHLIDMGGDAPDDPYGEVVIDQHAASVAAGKRLSEAGPIDNARFHEYVADQYRQAAAEISRQEGMTIAPHQVQAVTWLVQQRRVEADDAARQAAGLISPNDARLAKGRKTAARTNIRKWRKFLQANPRIAAAVQPGTTALATEVMIAQIIELLGDGSLLAELAVQPWLDEPRNDRGEWSKEAAALEPGRKPSTRIRKWITAAQARGNSRPVSMDEYQHLAALGNRWVDQAKRDHSPITGLDENWVQARAHAWDQVQKPWGGATIDAHTGRPLETDADLYALSVKPKGMHQVQLPENATQDEFYTAMDQAKEQFRPALERKSFYLGVFHDDEMGKIDIDPVAVVDSTDLVEQVGAYTRAIGGAYHFRTGNGYWPPHVAEGTETEMAEGTDEGTVHFAGPGQWHRQAVEIQDPEPDDDEDDTGLATELAGWEDEPRDVKGRWIDLYHWTTPGKADKIIATGKFASYGADSDPDAVYFTDKPAGGEAEKLAGSGAAAVIHVRVPAYIADPDNPIAEDETWYKIDRNLIKPEHILSVRRKMAGGGSLATELAAIHGHHVPGTPYTYRHGWIPVAGGSIAQQAGLPWSAEGSTAHYHGSLGIDRAAMPQLTGNDPTGHYHPSAEMLPRFMRYLREHGVDVTAERVDPRSLRPTQATGDTDKIAELASKIRSGEIPDTKPIVVSEDSRVLDGHHNWAARVLADSEGGRADLAPGMTVYRAHEPIHDLLGHADAFGREHGLPKRAAGEFAAPADRPPVVHDSMSKYTDARGDWTPERAALHRQIIGRMLAGAGPPEAHPQAIFLGGGPGSGKTTALRGKTPAGAMKIAADDVKFQLPEYQAGIKAGDTGIAAYTHEESSAVSKMAVNAAQNGRHSFVLDGLGDSEYAKLAAKVNAARAQGYGVHAKYVTVDLPEVHRRTARRAEETGFKVPDAVTDEKHAEVTQAYYQAVQNGLFDTSELWDNNGQFSPRLIARSSGTQLEVLDPVAWANFLAKGGITEPQLESA